ncbi:hypothetical protein [Bacillus fonticola]|uniref:hypothetical protein n=1 Tax=Bacillus fonticola TaxID=2728853 RepID=UPI001D1366A9|nr:hypothetical protein [Bacillus fonticola]
MLNLDFQIVGWSGGPQDVGQEGVATGRGYSGLLPSENNLRLLRQKAPLKPKNIFQREQNGPLPHFIPQERKR